MPIIYNKNALTQYLRLVLSGEEYSQLESLEFEKMKIIKQKIFNYNDTCKNPSLTRRQ